MLLYYVRHGDPIYNPDSLTPLGKRQADAVAKRLTLYGVDRIFSSTSTRAIETAQPTAELTKLPIEQVDGANEKYAAKELGITRDGKWRWMFADGPILDLMNDSEVRALGDRWYTHPSLLEYNFEVGAERIHRVTDDFFAELGYIHDRERHSWSCEKPNDKRVALFAHGGFGVFFMASLLDIPVPYFINRFSISHSNVTVVNFSSTEGRISPHVLTYSNDSHLYREGIMTGYNNMIRF